LRIPSRTLAATRPAKALTLRIDDADARDTHDPAEPCDDIDDDFSALPCRPPPLALSCASRAAAYTLRGCVVSPGTLAVVAVVPGVRFVTLDQSVVFLACCCCCVRIVAGNGVYVAAGLLVALPAGAANLAAAARPALAAAAVVWLQPCIGMPELW